jgi:hypothetical protein
MADTRERDRKRKYTVPRHSSPGTETRNPPADTAERKPQKKSPIARDDRLIGVERFPRKGDDE